jgi:hypothetical protein
MLDHNGVSHGTMESVGTSFLANFLKIKIK